MPLIHIKGNSVAVMNAMTQVKLAKHGEGALPVSMWEGFVKDQLQGATHKPKGHAQVDPVMKDINRGIIFLLHTSDASVKGEKFYEGWINAQTGKPEAGASSFAQGDMNSGSGLATFFVNTELTALPEAEASQWNHPANRKVLKVGYLGDNNKPCSLEIAWHKDHPNQWFASVLRDTNEATLEARKSEVFLMFPQDINKKEAKAVSVSDPKAEIAEVDYETGMERFLECVGSKHLSMLLKHKIFDKNAVINADGVQAFEGQFLHQSDQSLINSDEYKEANASYQQAYAEKNNRKLAEMKALDYEAEDYFDKTKMAREIEETKTGAAGGLYDAAASTIKSMFPTLKNGDVSEIKIQVREAHDVIDQATNNKNGNPTSTNKNS